MRKFFRGKSLFAGLLAGLLLGWPAGPSRAQDLFSAVITVDDQAITGWELSQRQALLTFFNTPGDLSRIAREQLVEDLLKERILARAGLALSPEGMTLAMEEFAQRANLTAEQLETVVGQNGIEPETLRTYVRINVSWRDFIRTRFRDRVEVTEADIDAATLRQDQAAGIEVLLSEIIIPAPPEQAAEALATATAISRLTSTAAFEAEARRVSAVPSREVGGRLDWRALDSFPPALGQVFLGMEPGEVTPPLTLEGAVAILQLRGLRETSAPVPEVAELEYARFLAADAAAAEALLTRIDSCEDLYEEARGQPDGTLTRVTEAPGALPADVAAELARLDPNEASLALRDGAGRVVVLMLCRRIGPLPEGADREGLRGSLISGQLAGYADALLAEERASALIVGE